METSLIVPVMPTDPSDAVPFAELVRSEDMPRLWQGQSVTIETHQMFAYLAGMGFRILFGTAVTLMPLRHPMEAAAHARSLARLTGRRVTLGLGPGSPDFVASLCGKPYDSPKAACADYLRQVRDFLTEQRHEAPEAGWPASDLPDLGHAGVDIGLGVLRPALARLAGETADVAITWMTPPGYLARDVVPALRRGAQAAGRHVPRLVTVVHVAVDRHGRDPRQLAYAAAHTHLGAPHYTDMLRRAGLRVHPSQPYLNACALVDSGTFAYGTPREVAGALAEYARVGVDEVVLNCAGVGLAHGWNAALEDLAELSAEMRAVRSGVIA
ncbi:LLM class flavin-dependent oxidoreductase [Streptomyces dangxiongensis]|uniref:LLM class flavin-dependent oxidoreductase n=1 Tax=Streptomyces dangxiongensis TaxID=1442032 RepID=A0A3G2J8A0_9ACTN|nr:LLM class flavin-dependent oxidoreductase [Streptomyces dangxiongensis]AYN38493.1 LLM class flavin-dependent oxidoreductase [Streptomyces dangxiongensis]